jgi:hypothetical protein
MCSHRKRLLVQIALSMDAPQLLQVRIAVSDIRAMVECIPQSGHSERISKRCMQFTQR